MSAIVAPERHTLVAGKTLAHVRGYVAPEGYLVTVCGLVTDDVVPPDSMGVCLICTSKLRRARIEAKRTNA